MFSLLRGEDDRFRKSFDYPDKTPSLRRVAVGTRNLFDKLAGCPAPT